MGSLPENLPIGWEKTKLGAAIELKYGKGLIEKTRDGKNYPVYGSNGIVGYHSSPLLSGPALIVGRKGSIGQVHFSIGPCSPIDTTYFIDNFNDQPPTFWLNLLRFLRLEELNRATALPGLNREEAYDTEIVLPPLKEQSRIVAKIEALQERSSRARKALEAIPTLLEKFRQSVLAAAFRGDLTAGWRAQNPDLEPASVLLERIKKERRRRWEEAELAKMKAKGKAPQDNKWKQKYEEPAPVDTTDLPELPEGWCWSRLEMVAGVIDPHPSHRTPPQVHGGHPYIGIGDISKDGVIDFLNVRRVSKNVMSEHKKRYQLKKGDFIFGKIGTLGSPRLLPEPFDYTVSANVILIQPDLLLSKTWLFFYLASPQIESIINKTRSATSQPAFGMGKTMNLVIPIAPLDEQVEIVRKIRTKFEIMKRFLMSISKAALSLNELDQSILSKAFRGELVPQDPNDEPASVLLERIREERESTEGKKKGRGGSKSG